MGVPQLQLNFGSIHHLSDLHAKHRAGIAFAEMSELWREHAAIQYNQAVEFCREHSGQDDCYMAVNAFKPFARRCFENVVNLTANFVDLDFYNLGLSFDEALSGIVSRCHSLNIPEPSKVIDSGRGAYAIWEFKKPVYCGKKAEKSSKIKFAWQDTQAMLIAVFSDLGADPKCKDVSRVLRLVGTKNSKVNRKVQAYSLGERLNSPVSFSRRLKEITNPKIEAPKANVNKTKLAPAKPKTSIVSRGNVSTILNARSLNYARADDLRRLAELRGGLLTDNRAMAIFYYAMAASYVNVNQEGVCRSVSDFMESCIQCGGKYDANRPEKLLKTLLERHNTQKANALNGDYTQVQYRARNQTIIDALGITLEEQKHLETIIGKEEKYRRKNEKRNALRRDEYLAKAKSKVDKAKALKAEGVSNKQIALQLDVHVKSVSRLLKR